MGKLIFNHSTMGGGKSAILIAKFLNNPRHSIALKPSIDTRDGAEKIVSRNGNSIDCKTLNTSESIYSQIDRHSKNSGKKIMFIFIDEAQFLTKEQVEELLYISITYDVIIECYGLLVDFMSELFEGSKRLIEIADEIDLIQSYDTKGEPARQNKLLLDDLADSENRTILGKEEKFRAVSNKEYFKGEIELWQKKTNQ